MGTTTNFSLRYPAAGASNNVPSDIQNLATDTDTALNGRQAADADLTTIAGLDSTQTGVVASDGSGWIRKTYSAVKTSLSLVKGDVGLGNVDNTSDVNKPVSTAQQTALNLKAPLASPALTGTPTVPTAAGGTNTTQAASTAFVVAGFAAQSAAWTTWSPVITGATTNPTYTDNGSAYRVDGKTLFVRMSVSFNTVGSGIYTLAMPGGLSAQASCYGAASQYSLGAGIPLRYVASGTSIQFVRSDNNAAFNAAANTASAALVFSGVIETT